MAASTRIPFALALAFASSQVCALCPPPGLPPPSRYVGDMGTDAKCTDNDIQSAINNASCPNTFIVISREHTYTQQHLSINNKSIIFTATGNGVACNAGGGSTGGGGSTPTAPLVTISGNGNQSVFDIGGNSSVTFQFLEVTGGGGDSDSHGGGIDFNGTGSLTIDTSTIDVNHSGNGGGIEMNGNGGSATLTLKAYSIIESNTAAGNGGGINIEGNAELMVAEPFTLIGFNHAPNGKGGGVAVVGPARADIGSPGFNGLPVLDANDAALGGAISIEAVNDGDDAFVTLVSTDAENPVTLSGNFASRAGGAVYALPLSDFFSSAVAELCAADFRIDGNAAPEGAAIFGDVDTSSSGDVGGTIDFNLSNGCGSKIASTPCDAGVTCNTLDDNRAVDANNHPTQGAVIFDQAGVGTLNRFAVRGNEASHAIRTVDTNVDLSNCLIADNTFSAETARFEDNGDGGSNAIDSCTIANNSHNSGSVIHTEHDLTLTDSIVDQPVMSTLSKAGSPTITAQNILAADPTGLAAQAGIVTGEPTYVNAAAGDYHLRAVVQNGNVTASMGIDFAPPVTGDDRDLDNNPHDQDVALIPNLFGDRDLGCYEAQPISDRIFGDAFGDPMSLVY